MNRTVCLRALAIVPLASLGVIGGPAGAEQPESSPGQQADTHSTTKSTQKTMAPVQAPLMQLTPAQQRYGLPKNPIIGHVVDTDLSKPLTLDRAIQIGLLRQNSIAIAQTQVESSSARLVAARASYFPHVTPSVQYSTTLSPPGGFFVSGGGSGGGGASNVGGGITSAGGSSGGSTTGSTTGSSSSSSSTSGSSTTTGSTTGNIKSSRQTGTTTTTSTPVVHSTTTESRTDVVAISQNIYDSGLREASVAQSRRNLFASQYAVANDRQIVILDVTQSYYNLLRDKELVRVQQENVTLAQANLDSIRAQVAVGNAAQSDTYQTESSLANAQVSLLQAQSDYSVAQATLKQAMGVVSSLPLNVADQVAPQPDTTPDPLTLDQYILTAYNNRLDIKEQQENIYSQGYAVRTSQINAGLYVSADISEGYQLFPHAGEEREFSVSFSYPLFDAGSARSAIRESKAGLEQQRRSLDQLEQSVHFNVEQSYQVREQARQRVIAGQTAVQAGQVNYNAALEKQKNGLVNVLDVINAEVQLVNAQVSLVQAIYDFYIAQAQLQRNVGLNDTAFIPHVPGAKRPTPVASTAPPAR